MFFALSFVFFFKMKSFQLKQIPLHFRHNCWCCTPTKVSNKNIVPKTERMTNYLTFIARFSSNLFSGVSNLFKSSKSLRKMENIKTRTDVHLVKHLYITSKIIIL